MRDSNLTPERATEIVASLFGRLRDLHKQRDELCDEIDRLEGLVKQLESAVPQGTAIAAVSTPSGRVPRGTVEPSINKALLLAPKGLTESQLIEKIKEVTGISLARSSIYSVLRRGRKSGKYLKKGQFWRLHKGKA